MNEPRIVRHDVEKIPRLLQRPDNRVVRAFENANHASFGAAGHFLRARIIKIARDPRHHAIAIHRRSGIFRRDVNVGLARLFH